MKWNLGRIVSVCSILFGGILWLSIGVREYNDSKQLAARGKITQGQVWGGDDTLKKNSWWSGYHLQVKFATEEGSTHQERVRVNQELYTNARSGQKITVHYLSEDPGVCQAGETVRLQYGSIYRGLIFLTLAAFLILTYRRPMNVEEAAKRINEDFKMLTLDRYEYISVDARKFRRLDLSFYDELQRYLESEGFRFLDDQQNVSVRPRNRMPVFNRYLLDKDGTTMAIIYHFVPKLSYRLLGSKSWKVLNLETWLSDSTFICASNAEPAGKLNLPPTISALYLPATTPWEAMVEAHRRKLGSHLASHSGVKLVVLETMADVRRAQDEQQRIKAEFRKRTGLTKQELQRFRDGPRTDKIYDALTARRERGE